jgi:hypothetical protein
MHPHPFKKKTYEVTVIVVQAAQHYGYGVNGGHYPNPRDPMGYGGYYQQCAMSPHQARTTGSSDFFSDLSVFAI